MVESDDGVDFKAYSPIESSLFSFQCIWSTKKKRSLKLVKSKEFSRKEEREGGMRPRPVIFRVYSRKRKRLSRVGSVEGSDGVEVILTEAPSHEKLQHSVDDDVGVVLGDWIKQKRRFRLKSGEDKRIDSEVKTVSVTKVEPLEDDTLFPSWSPGRFTGKRKNRRRVGLDVKSEMKSMSVMKVEPSVDHGRSTGRKRDRLQVELEEDVAWEEELQMISKIQATNRRRRRGSHSPEHLTRASGSRSRSPDSLLKNGCSDDPESLKSSSKVTRLCISYFCMNQRRTINVFMY